MTMPTVYAGIHHPAMAQHVPHTMVSINPLLNRRSDFYPNDWRLDSGAFSRARQCKHCGPEHPARVGNRPYFRVHHFPAGAGQQGRRPAQPD